jgi:glycosyltransferase involved in cell wall biosynthesis
LPEVSGEAALLVDPKKSEEIKKALKDVAKSSSLRGELIEKGIKRVGGYSWEKAAKETLAVLERIGGR